MAVGWRGSISYRVSDLDQDIVRTNLSGGGGLNDLSLLGTLEDSEINHFDRCGSKCKRFKSGGGSID